MKTPPKQTLCLALSGAFLWGSCATHRLPEYDERPENKPGLLVRAASPHYTIEDDKTFPVFKNPYQPAGLRGYPIGRGLYELYRGKDATYLTCSYRLPENWWFFGFYSGDMLIDRKTGDRYMMRKVEYYPTDTCFWISGKAGMNVRFVMEFPPLPKKVKKIDYFQAGGPSRYNFDGSPKRIENLRVKHLRPNMPAGRIIR